MNEMLTVKEAARLLKIETMTVYRWMDSGKLCGYKQGYRRLFKKEDIDRLIAEATQLRLDTKPRERTVIELKFFEQLKANLTESESFEFMFYPHAEREYHELILALAKKYKIPIPKWFKKECRQWDVTT